MKKIIIIAGIIVVIAVIVLLFCVYERRRGHTSAGFRLYGKFAARRNDHPFGASDRTNLPNGHFSGQCHGQ